MKEKDKREIETGREPNWENIIRECRSSGNTVAAWCREHGISTRQYYYRLKKAEYRSKIETLLQKNAELSEENAGLRQQVAFFKKALYGQKSEKTAVITEVSEQLSMFDEAEQEAEITAKHAEEEIEIAAHKRKAKRTQDEIMGNLPTEEVLHEAEDKVCPECGAEMQTVGKEYVRSELVYVPAKRILSVFSRIRTFRLITTARKMPFVRL